jgi:hypothetical protein
VMVLSAANHLVPRGDISRQRELVGRYPHTLLLQLSIATLRDWKDSSAWAVVGVDLGENVAEVVGWAVGGVQGLSAGFDLDCAVAAGGSDEFRDAPAGLVFDPVADGRGLPRHPRPGILTEPLTPRTHLTGIFSSGLT